MKTENETHDEFIEAALTGILANPNLQISSDKVASTAIRYADKVMLERAKFNKDNGI